jgi:hypothetical protein
MSGADRLDGSTLGTLGGGAAQALAMLSFVLYHRQPFSAPVRWNRLGVYDTLEAAQSAAGEHASTPRREALAWIMEQRATNEWRLVADGQTYRVERVVHAITDQLP